MNRYFLLFPDRHRLNKISQTNLAADIHIT